MHRCYGDSTGKKHAFPALCKGHRNGKQFLRRHGQFDIHLCLSRYVLASVIAIKPQNPADFCVCVHRSWLVKLAWKSRFDNNYKELRFLTGGKNWTPLKYLKMEFMRAFDGKNMFGIQWTWIWILVPLPNPCDFKQIFNLSKPMKIGVMSYRIARRLTYITV